jgi:hypothetical protein
MRYVPNLIANQYMTAPKGHATTILGLKIIKHISRPRDANDTRELWMDLSRLSFPSATFTFSLASEVLLGLILGSIVAAQNIPESG